MKHVTGRGGHGILAGCAACLLGASLAPAQVETDFALRAVPSLSEVDIGSSFTMRTLLSSESAGLAAWAFGQCIDNSKLMILDAQPGEDLEAVFFGAPPEYWTIQMWTEAGHVTGVTQAVVLDLQGGASIKAIPASAAISVLRVELRPVPTVVGQTLTVPFCNTVGAPPVETLFVVGATGYVPATQEAASVDVVRDPPSLIAFSEDFPTFSMAQGSLSLAARIRSTDSLYGFSFGVAHNAAKLTLGEATLADDLKAVLGGAEPDFWAINPAPAGGAGVTIGVVFDVPASGTPPTGDLVSIKSDAAKPSTLVMNLVYTAGPQAAVGETTALTIVDTLGSPPVAVIFDIGVEHLPRTRECVILFKESAETPPFIRGDISGDGKLNISDVTRLLRYLFGGSSPGYDCEDALDINDDGRLNVADPTYLLGYLYVSGPAPPAPFPACGTLPEDHPTLIGCRSYPGCAR